MRKRILVVDDSETVLAVARDVLERAGFDVVSALDAHEADQYIFCQDKPDLIVLDIMLPGLEGHTKAKALEDHVRRLVYESGADGYLRKPFTDEEIVAKIKEKL